ncbi:MAG TPA: lectin-like protein [Syntrophales bacterium]|nr:lectin-like protein [Syntrophales bacterium]
MKKKVIVTIVLVIIICCAVAAQSVACMTVGPLADSTFSGDNEYILVFKKGVSWDDAAAEVASWGSSYHLATITSKTEQRYVQKLLQGVNGEFWIGGYQDGSNKWHWATNEPWNYHRWSKGEPNDYYGHDSEQHLAIWSKYRKHAWMWNDEGNLRNISGFLVEREMGENNPPNPVVPIPGVVWLLGSGLAMLGGVRVVKGRVS